MKEKLEKFINKIHLGDNVEIMNSIPEKSIDLIFADPPYNMQLDKKLIRYSGKEFEGVNDEWDKYNSLRDYDNEVKIWLKSIFRILKDNGSLWVIGSFHNIHRLGYILQDMGAWILNEIVWEKSNPVPNFAGTRFVNSQETMLWVTKDKKSKFTFNYKTMKNINGGVQMKSVWKLPISSGNERLKDKNGKKVHSTQKPLELLKRIILSSSNYGDVILDPFSGTGTTAHAAKLLGRKYIAIERESKYVKASRIRLNNVKETREIKLKKAILDIKPKKVTFMELINENYIDINEPIYLKNQKFIFNKKGLISYKGELFSPNALAKKLFGKPTNSWDHIKYKNNPISKVRDVYRKDFK